MVAQEDMKPSYDEWMYWTQVIVDRLTTVTHVYGNPPHADVFMSEREKQEKLAQTVDLMRRLHNLTDENELSMPADNADEAHAHELRLIEGLQLLYREVLDRLPLLSQDMQKLLKSPWYDDCAGKLANILFRGALDKEREGIGSGMPENGRLPTVIEGLLEREASGDGRVLRVKKPPQAPPFMRREEIARLWGKRNSAFLRSAGRVD
ncbi:MAG TPA: hypothetical protein DD400_06160 [Rhodospirillaceae bacterium]|nr:hypothetical protein [Rhodospirillaceae bacterium]